MSAPRSSMRRREARGFTLVELLVVMAILATLAGLGMVMIPKMMLKAKKDAVQNFISVLAVQVETYKTTQGAYPPTTLADYAGEVVAAVKRQGGRS